MKENRSNTNTVIYFEVRVTALRPRLHTEGFSLCPHRTFHRGTSTEELQLQLKVHNLSLTPLHKREGIKPKQRKDYNLVIQLSQTTLGDLKGSQTIFSQKKILKIGLELIGLSM